MTRMVLWLSAGMVLLAGAGQVLAHHSFTSTYDSSQRVEIEGLVKEVVWRNPHSFVRLDVTEKDGAVRTWALEWSSVSALAQSQLSRTTLRPGDRLLVTGEPAREAASPRLLIVSMKRPSDGWSWQGRVD